MAENEDGTTKSEDASPRKLEEARKQGDVAKSMEVAQVAALAGAFGAIVFAGRGIAQNLVEQMRPFIAHPEAINLQGQAGVSVAWRVMGAALPALLTVLGAATAAGVFGNVVQTGLLFAPSKLAPSLDKLSPTAGFKRLFGIDGLMNFLRSALKVGLVGAVAWWVLAPRAHDFLGLIGMAPVSVLSFSMGLATQLMFAVLALLALLALVDFIWQRQRFLERMKMTKEEHKEDLKQSDGDPHVKARQRQIRNERARRRMIQQVPKATVVIANPTHFAVALLYKQGETPAPQCLAKGVDAVALRIREVAEEHGVPVIEDPPLARALYAAIEIDQFIPTQHYEAVAKIIGFIFAGRRRQRARTL